MQPATIFDIKRASKLVAIGDQQVQVSALSIGDLTDIANRFEAVRALLMQQRPSSGSILACGREAVGAIIAATQGKLGDQEAETVAGALELAVQTELIIAAYEVTFPGGIDPFVHRLRALGINLRPAPADETTRSSPSLSDDLSQPTRTDDRSLNGSARPSSP